jgi:hypothetical protein
MLARSVERRLAGGPVVREPEIHDHAVLLVVNAFKDKIAGAPRWALEDLERIVARIDLETFLARVGEARLLTMTWLVADWLYTHHGSEPWRGVRDILSNRVPRRLYARLMRRLIDRTPNAPILRPLARVGCDSMARQVGALAASLAGTTISAVWFRDRPSPE